MLTALVKTTTTTTTTTILYITYICDGFIDIGIHIHAIKTYMNASCKES